MTLGYQVLVLFVLAMPVACVAWTITHEEVFREARERCTANSKSCRQLYKRKFFYVFTCEYCFSHYVGCQLHTSRELVRILSSCASESAVAISAPAHRELSAVNRPMSV